MREAKNEIKKHLWGWGHSVKDVADIPGAHYDLLIDGITRFCMIEREITDDCDVIANVGKKKKYRINRQPIKWQSISKILGPKSQKTKRPKKIITK